MTSPHDIKKETEKAIEETLFLPDPQGHTRFGREVHDAVFEDGSDGSPSRFQRELRKGFYQTFGKWFFGGGAVVLLGLSGLYFQVQEHEEKLSEGGRYTEADAIEDSRLQEQRDARQDEDIQNLRVEINTKLDQIINRLIP
jgi:hypothetical protein